MHVFKHNLKKFLEKMDDGSVYGIPVSSFTHLVVADLERKCHRARSVLFDVDPSMCGLVHGLQNNCC